MSQGTYSASSFRRSNTSRAASMTSCPTPSPGIHAILYLAIRCRVYRCRKRVASWGTRALRMHSFVIRRSGRQYLVRDGRSENTKLKVHLGEDAETSTQVRAGL